ncbi:MAG: hypothetical protein RR739_03930, partial [Clostridia bacterium]
NPVRSSLRNGRRPAYAGAVGGFSSVTNACEVDAGAVGETFLGKEQASAVCARLKSFGLFGSLGD